MDRVKNIKVIRYEGGFQEIEDSTIVEFPFTIFLDDNELVTLLCSPQHLEYLALGFLYSEGLLKCYDDIVKVDIDDEKGIAYVKTKGNNSIAKALYGKRTITSGCGKGTTFYNVVDSIKTKKIDNQTFISPSQVFNLTKEVDNMSSLFKQTGGVHGCALCTNTEILFFHEDIGRHNALDKILGEALKEGINLEDKIIITTGRISSEMLLKSAKRSVPIIVSRSASTELAMKLADELGITLVGFVRGKRMNIYSTPWRIKEN